MRSPNAEPQFWRWLVAWFIFGAGFAFALAAMASMGFFVMPIPIVVTILLVKYQPSTPTMPALVSGLGLPLLYVAYLNCGGSRMIRTTTPTMTRRD